jgi:tetratricopeptide (TPR) repeat protein
MRKAGLRDAEAFTLYQRGLEYYANAHGEIDIVSGLREANTYFEQVIERVPTYGPVYIDHSDLYVHLLTDDAADVYQLDGTAEELADAHAIILADYQAAKRYATSPSETIMADLDLVYISDNWRGIDQRMRRAVEQPGCHTGNWIQIISPIFGHAEGYLEHALRVLECDPASSASWFNVSRTAMRTGNIDAALAYAKEGMEVAPGSWLATTQVRALVAKGRFDEAHNVLSSIQVADVALAFEAMIAAAEGDEEQYNKLRDQLEEQTFAGHYWVSLVSAWGGKRDAANAAAAAIDQHRFGAATLSQMVLWCGCGAPFDLESTPNFAARIEEGDLPWPPEPFMNFPLKNW